jgi:ABC-type lipoprotein release transport system permease subunit
VLGLAAAWGLVRVMRTLLYEVDPSDPASMALVAVVLTATAAAASWWPARRAMRVDPATLLREE